MTQRILATSTTGTTTIINQFSRPAVSYFLGTHGRCRLVT